jgi:ATP-dependent protease ClpP protease subunit
MVTNVVQRGKIPRFRQTRTATRYAEIVPQTSEVLTNAVTNLVNQGFREIHLLLSTPAGMVMLGITIYNMLRGLPIDLTTHNVGNVDSIVAVIYLAGEHRPKQLLCSMESGSRGPDRHNFSRGASRKD